MQTNPETFTVEITDALATIGENHTVETVDLGEYGTSYAITGHDSGKTLHITPVEDDLIDMVLYDKTGTTLAHGTLFGKTVTDITPKKLADLIAICF